MTSLDIGMAALRTVAVRLYDLYDRIVTGKRKDEFDKYLAKLRAQAIIEWKNPDIKKAFEEGLAEQTKQAKLSVQ